MNTPEQYATISDKAYNTDLKKTKKPIRANNASSIFDDPNSGQKYKVLDTVDSNDSNNRKGYETNGFQAMAVAPIKENGKPDYKHITISFAGTNTGDLSKDGTADFFNVVLGVGKYGIVHSQFTSAQRFYKEIAKKYGAKNIEAVTGHSLGGALAQKVAAAFHIPAITFSTASVGKQLTEKEKAWINGKGKKFVLNFMHGGDQVPAWTNAADYGTTIYAFDFSLGLPFSGHLLESYRFDKNGSLIGADGTLWEIRDQPTLNVGIDGTLWGFTVPTSLNAEIDGIYGQFKSQLQAISDLKKRFAESGGGLSSSEKIYLDSAQAFAVVSTASSEFKLLMLNISQFYKNNIQKTEALWQNTLKYAITQGDLLEPHEILAALKNGGYSKHKSLTLPTKRYQETIDKVREMSEQFQQLEHELKEKISELVDRDSELAQQLRE